MVSLFISLVDDNLFIKKLFFSHNFIEGVWIGFYFYEKNAILSIKQIEQSSDSIKIKGQTFFSKAEGAVFRGTWESTGASFDDDKLTLNITYSTSRVDKEDEGFARMSFIKRGNKEPDMFIGYTKNYGDDERKSTLICKKYYDLNNSPGMSKLIEMAFDFYKDNYSLNASECK